MQLFTSPQPANSNKFSVNFAQNLSEIREAQALRYQVFALEMGATLDTDIPNYDIDLYDNYCHHLLARDLVTQQVVGYTRILTCDQIGLAGGFYSSSEFDLTPIRKLSGRFMEIGRTCVHADYRNKPIIHLLWASLAKFMVSQQFDYLMGCASIPLPSDDYLPLFDELLQRHAHPSVQVTPRVPLIRGALSQDNTQEIPALLKAYLRLGAQICGEPCWDENFKVADLFILLDKANLQQRYLKHFIQRAEASASHPASAVSFHEVAA